MLKAVIWAGSARRDVRAFAKDAREASRVRALQSPAGPRSHGLEADAVGGPGVREIRIHTDGEHRVIYVARFEEAIYVLHAFEKKTRKTRRADMDVGRKRLRDVLRDRERKKASPARG